MQKTKIGISVGLLGAAIYFMGLLGGYVATVLLVGYVLLFEENEWLRKSSVKAIGIMILFSLLSSVIGLIPNAINFIDYIFSIFGSYFRISVVSDLIGAINTALTVIEKLLMIGLGIKALNQGTMSVPVVDKLIDKFME